MKTYFTLFLILIYLDGFSQIIIRGKIVDANTKKPIENVAVSAARTGCISDQKGLFSLIINDADSKLKFSHIAYQTLNINFPFNTDTILNIELIPKPIMLNEVPVSAIQRVVNTPGVTVIDYIFKSPGVIILAYDSPNHYFVGIVDDKGHIRAKHSLDQKAQKIKRSANDSILLIYKQKVDYICQGRNKLKTVFCCKRYPLFDYEVEQSIFFNKMLVFPVFFSNRYVALASYYPNDSLIRYRYYLQDDDILYRPENWGIHPNDVYNMKQFGLRRLNNHKIQINTDYPTLPLAHTEPNITPNNLAPKSIKYLNQLQYYKNVIDQPISILLFQTKKYICLLDVDHRQVYIFGHDLMLIDQITLRTNIHRINIENILYDASRDQIYLVNKKGSKRDLYMLNHKDGKVQFCMPLPYPFVSKLRIFNGFLYYLKYKQSYYGSSNERIVLYRIKINRTDI